MMKNLIFLSISIIIFLAACNKKEGITQPLNSSNLSQANPVHIDTSKGWYGLYRYFFESPDDTSYNRLSDKSIIANGEARVPYMEDVNATIIDYDMPGNHVINADSTTFDMDVRESIPRIDLNLFGMKHNASLSYYTYNDSGFYTIAVGSVVKQKKVFPATDFTSYKLVRFQFKQNKLSVSVANKVIASFTYGATYRLGNLKQISLGNQGYIECNYVRLNNSYTQSSVMHEEFNIDGKSHTIFY